MTKKQSTGDVWQEKNIYRFYRVTIYSHSGSESMDSFYVGSIFSTSCQEGARNLRAHRKWTLTSLVAGASMYLWEYSLENLLFFLSKILLWIKIGNVRFFCRRERRWMRIKRKGGGNSPNLKHQSKCKRINSYVKQVFTIFGHVKTL